MLNILNKTTFNRSHISLHLMKQLLLIATTLIALISPLYIHGATATGDTISSGETATASRRISGVVNDENGMPIIGASVKIDGEANSVGTVTDIDGKFYLTIDSPTAILDISYIGYDNVRLHVTADANHYAVAMPISRQVLDEVVVVGYGTQRKVDLTGSVASIGKDALADRPLTNATNALAGLAPGLTVTNSGGNTPGYEAQSITVRGQGTLNNSAPLVVVDGMTGIAISDLNPQDIENISILKDAASAAIYGSRAANGVILITTRQGAESSPRFTYSGNVSFETVAKRLNLVTDYADFMEIQNAGLIANGQAARFSQGKIDEWRNDAGRNPTIYPNTDWQDHIYRNPSVVQNHNLAVTGGGRRVRYNLSFGYVDNPGMIYYTDYKRYQLRTNLEVNVKPWLTIGTNLFGYIDSNNPSSENATAGGDVIF